ncbi:hypothetical protein, partial [Tolypothrix sp. LEGE 11397]|uniref:hypothetical protein n=1 Tax=Tolypothrix sp. LEGE 11397 TaxID=2777971 RepID=UPI001D13C6CE
IPLAIFVHKFDCWCGWTGLYHALCLGSSIFTLLYYCQSDKTGLSPYFSAKKFDLEKCAITDPCQFHERAIADSLQ